MTINHYCKAEPGVQFGVCLRSMQTQYGRVYHEKRVFRSNRNSLLYLWERAKALLYEKNDNNEYKYHSVTLIKGEHRIVFTR